MITQLPDDDALREPDRPPDKINRRPGDGPIPALMTAATLKELRDELERLRRRTGLEIAQRLREARSYGDGSNNDEYHAIREEQLVLEARMTALKHTIARATLIELDDAGPGAAVIGSMVSIEDLASGTTSRYRLTSAHHSLTSNFISAASPIGQALIGTLPGTIVTVDLPNGNSRSLRLVSVETGHPNPAVSSAGSAIHRSDQAPSA